MKATNSLRRPPPPPPIRNSTNPSLAAVKGNKRNAEAPSLPPKRSSSASAASIPIPPPLPVLNLTKNANVKSIEITHSDSTSTVSKSVPTNRTISEISKPPPILPKKPNVIKRSVSSTCSNNSEVSKPVLPKKPSLILRSLSSASTPDEEKVKVPRPRECSPESGISVNFSSSSSLPSTASLETSSCQEVDTSTGPSASIPFNSTRCTEDTPFMKDLSLCLQNSSLHSSSLPTISTFEESMMQKLDFISNTISTNNSIVRKPAPKPPVRKDSIKTSKKKTFKFNLEDRFKENFHAEELLPPPSPFSKCRKTYPTKELFASPCKDDGEDSGNDAKEPQSISKSERTKKSRRFSTLFSLKSSPSASSDFLHQRNRTGSVDSGILTSMNPSNNSPKPLTENRSVLSRDSFLLKTKKPCVVRRSNTVCSPMRPKVKINRVNSEEKENLRISFRRAPPPPPPRYHLD